MSRQSSQPPAIAERFLRHFIARKNREALAGDLLETFRQGRSGAWYWRQVLIAILVGAASELRARWLPIAFAGAGTAFLSFFPFEVPIDRTDSLIMSLWSRSLALPWPVSGACQFALSGLIHTVMVLPVFALLLLLSRSYDWARMVRSLALNSLLLAIAEWALFWWLAEFRSSPSLAAEATHYFFPLLLAALATSPLRPRPRDSAIATEPRPRA